MYSIVVATFNRAPVLRRVLRTVLAQTYENWEAIIIGDCCTDDTAQQIASLGDPRLRFVNLPERFGEQSGPNSVGCAVAQGSRIAFLNHDDYWLPNHLAMAEGALDESGSDMYWSRAAFFTNRGASLHAAFFLDVSPASRQLEDLYDFGAPIAEPMSAWVLTRHAMERLGPMKRASDSWVGAPIVDYTQRASRLGLSLCNGNEITVLKDAFNYPPPTYQNSADFAESWIEEIESGDVSSLKDVIYQDLFLSRQLGHSRQKFTAFDAAQRSTSAEIDRQVGLNLVEVRGRAKGRSDGPNLIRGVAARRTGEAVENQPDMSSMIAYAMQTLE